MSGDRLDGFVDDATATIASALRLLRDLFRPASGEGAVAEARMLVGGVTGRDLGGLLVGGTDPIAAADRARIAAGARRRLGGEPIQRILGEADFFGRTFVLTPATLVPRPDTETLVEAVLSRISGVHGPVVADLGVGSGAILVTLLAERADAVGVGCDLSGEAVATARGNAVRHGVDARALFVRGSYASMLAPSGFDAVVSNPPYIETATIATLDAEVRLHDPRLALDGGADGLDAYRTIAGEAASTLRPGGLLAVEIGSTQATAVAAILAAAGWGSIETVRDLAGRDRVVTARTAGRETAAVRPMDAN